MLGLYPGVKLLIMVYTYVSKVVPSIHSHFLKKKKEFLLSDFAFLHSFDQQRRCSRKDSV